MRANIKTPTKLDKYNHKIKSELFNKLEAKIAIYN